MGQPLRRSLVALAAAALGLALVTRMRRRKCAQARDVPTSTSPPLDADDARRKAKAHLRFANACARAHQFERALAHYERSISVDATYALARHHAAGVCQRLRRWDDAVSHYEAALELSPTLLEAATNVAVAHLNAKRPRSAVRCCYRALRLQEELGW